MRTLVIAFLVSAAWACSSSSSTDATAARDSICVYSSAECYADLKQCPPSDASYSEICSEEAEQNCRDRVRGPELRSKSGGLTLYVRDVRIVHGITTCPKFRESGETTATSIDRLCEGDCH